MLGGAAGDDPSRPGSPRGGRRPGRRSARLLGRRRGTSTRAPNASYFSRWRTASSISSARASWPPCRTCVDIYGARVRDAIEQACVTTFEFCTALDSMRPRR